ncbi:MAG TPA: hypothetical protein PLB18_10955 [Acidobacteriota bacterium]|nr:hypothetical protein [Acidobacteriota bacterium]HND19886.1 hypothetical protein [Acidobacteriota bacterium]HNG92400.1 hypothetical protein [Acidobacteriota bacterium]HNH81118.1 hypothetical protein [Acidobacteriota bacterium]
MPLSIFPESHPNLGESSLTGLEITQKWTILSSLPHLVLFYFVHFYLRSHPNFFETWISELLFMLLLASFLISWFIGITSLRLANTLVPENKASRLLYLGTCLHFFPTTCLIYIYFAGGRGLFGIPCYCATE